MKKNFLNIFTLLALGITLVSCNNDDKLDSESYLPTGDGILENKIDKYLFKTFTEPYNIDVHYRWDRNIYGPTKDNNRNLYPPKLENVLPTFEMVNHVWIKSYKDVAGEEFVKELRPVKMLAAGGYAFNEDGTRTLGLASSGVQITLYEVDYLQGDVASAREFIHTIQHEYIHIINQKQEFNQVDFSAKNLGDYTTQWMEFPSELRNFKRKNGQEWDINSYGNILGFVTGYSRSNTIEDFAEVASYLLTNKPAQYEAMLAEIEEYDQMTQAQRDSFGLTDEFYRAGGASKIRYKVALVKEYFTKFHGIDFDKLITEANKNADSSPMLNGGNTGGIMAYGVKKTVSSVGKKGVVKFCQHFADDSKKIKGL